MPGTSVAIGAQAGSATSAVPTAGQMFVVGQSQRGSKADVVTLNSMQDFVRILGPQQAYSWAYHACRCFFEDGGGQVQFVRVVGPGATFGSVVLLDQHAGGGVPTLTVTAVDPGPWSSALSATITAGAIPNTFNLQLFLSGVLVEQYLNLASPALAAQALTASAYARGADGGSTTAAPSNNPAVGSFALSAGNDDRTSITPALMVAALSRFPLELGAGVVTIPGFSAADTAAGLKSHCLANGRTFYTTLPQGTSLTTAQTLAASFVDLDLGGECGALLWPWVTYADSGVTYTVPAEGFAASGRAKAFAAVGPWQAAAGVKYAQSSFLTGVEFAIGAADGNTLDAAHVQPIRLIGGQPTVYGARSLSLDAANWDILAYREIVNAISADLQTLLEDENFGTVDAAGRYYSRLSGEIRGYLAPIASAGGLFPLISPTSGLEVDPGYAVDTSGAVETPGLIAAGQAAAVVSVRPAPTASSIVITLVKAALTATL